MESHILRFFLYQMLFQCCFRQTNDEEEVLCERISGQCQNFYHGWMRQGEPKAELIPQVSKVLKWKNYHITKMKNVGMLLAVLGTNVYNCAIAKTWDKNADFGKNDFRCKRKERSTPFPCCVAKKDDFSAFEFSLRVAQLEICPIFLYILIHSFTKANKLKWNWAKLFDGVVRKCTSYHLMNLLEHQWQNAVWRPVCKTRFLMSKSGSRPISRFCVLLSVPVTTFCKLSKHFILLPREKTTEYSSPWELI